MKAAVKQHHATLYGNGQPGVVEFVAATKGQFRLLVILISVVGVLVAIVALLETNRQIHSGMLSENPISFHADLAQMP